MPNNPTLDRFIQKYTDYIAEYRITTNSDPNDGHVDFDEDEFKARIAEAIQSIIGPDSSYSDFCTHCNDWDDGRNSLLDEQRARAKEWLEESSNDQK